MPQSQNSEEGDNEIFKASDQAIEKDSTAELDNGLIVESLEHLELKKEKEAKVAKMTAEMKEVVEDDENGQKAFQVDQDLSQRNLQTESTESAENKQEIGTDDAVIASAGIQSSEADAVEELVIMPERASSRVVISEHKSSKVEVHGEDGQVEFLAKNAAQFEGDVCRMPSNKNKVKGKRRLEAKTAKKTFILMMSFVGCRIFYLASILVRQIARVSETSFDIEVILEQFSFTTCFFNSFTFILITEFFKSESERYIWIVYNSLKSYFYRTNDKKEKNLSFK